MQDLPQSATLLQNSRNVPHRHFSLCCPVVIRTLILLDPSDVMSSTIICTSVGSSRGSTWVSNEKTSLCKSQDMSLLQLPLDKKGYVAYPFRHFLGMQTLISTSISKFPNYLGIIATNLSTSTVLLIMV